MNLWHKTSFAGALLLSTLTLSAQTELASLINEAYQNTFTGGNYSWRTVVTLPDGATRTMTGQTASATTLTTAETPDGTRMQLEVGEQRFVFRDNGWIAAPVAPGERPNRPSPPVDRMGLGPAGLGRPGPGGPMTPAAELARWITRVTGWTFAGDTFSGTVSGGRRGPGPTGGAAAPDAATLKLRLTDGLIHTAAIETAAAPANSRRIPVLPAVTEISAVGQTTVTIPAEVQALLTMSATSSR